MEISLINGLHLSMRQPSWRMRDFDVVIHVIILKPGFHANGKSYEGCEVLLFLRALILFTKKETVSKGPEK